MVRATLATPSCTCDARGGKFVKVFPFDRRVWSTPVRASSHKPLCGFVSGCFLGHSVGPCKDYKFFDFLSRAREGPGAPGRPPRAIRGPSRGLRGPPGASRRPPGPKTNQSKKPRNLKGLTERWRATHQGVLHKPHAAPSFAQQATIVNPNTGQA